MILYFPVSALVTLFANVLQNPQDARARSDVKLMNQVVNFLSILSLTEEQGGVKRMLGVCAEFERIAKCVLDKTEKGSKRHKRKSSKINGAERGKTSSTPKVAAQRIDAQPSPQAKPASPPVEQHLAQDSSLDMANQQYYQQSDQDTISPPTANINAHPPKFDKTNDHMTDVSAMLNQPSNNPEAGGPSDAGHNATLDMSHFPTDNPRSPLNMGAFQQPFVPQDLWNMNMTLEWDWQDMNIDGFDPTQAQNPSMRPDRGSDGIGMLTASHDDRACDEACNGGFDDACTESTSNEGN